MAFLVQVPLKMPLKGYFAVVCVTTIQNFSNLLRTKIHIIPSKLLDPILGCFREALLIGTSIIRTLKSELAWTTKEEKHTNVNSKTLHAIFCGVDRQEFKRISKFTTSKDA